MASSTLRRATAGRQSVLLRICAVHPSGQLSARNRLESSPNRGSVLTPIGESEIGWDLQSMIRHDVRAGETRGPRVAVECPPIDRGVLVLGLVTLVLAGWGAGELARAGLHPIDLRVVHGVAAQRSRVLSAGAKALSLFGGVLVIGPLAAVCCLALHRSSRRRASVLLALSTSVQRVPPMRPPGRRHPPRRSDSARRGRPARVRFQARGRSLRRYLGGHARPIPGRPRRRDGRCGGEARVRASRGDAASTGSRFTHGLRPDVCAAGATSRLSGWAS
jgi:hypothetical protein